MSWQDDPATPLQLTTIRDFYAKAIGWTNSMIRIKAMKDGGLTKGQASKELKRLHNLSVYGQWTGPEDWVDE